MRRYLIFIIAGFALLMYSIDGTVVAVAFPSLVKDLNTDVLWAAWTISIFFIAVTMAMPLAGKLSDSFGRKKVFLVSLIMFTTSSLACGLAPNIYCLIAFRFLQGIGGASFLPTASGIVSDHFPESRERAIGLFSSIFSIGSIIGPNLGGWIVSFYSWRYVFYINLPIGIGLIVLSLMLLKKDSKVFSRRHVDFGGASLFSGAVLFLMFGLNLIAESFSPLSFLFTAIFLALSLYLVLLFLRHEKKETNPILDIALLQSKPFLAANLLNLIIGIAVFGIFSFIPFYATSVHKLSTLMSGVILTPQSLGSSAAAAITSFLLRRWGYRWPMVWGFAIIAGVTVLLAPGLLLWNVLGLRWGSAVLLSSLLLVSGIGMGMAFPAANNACIELMPEKVGTIVGLRNMFRTVGGALGISLITVILHVSVNPAAGFRIIFLSFGLTLLCSVPLAFLMPAGKRAWG
jgi:EmrB/QacA subfamily drug resistance transporter